MIIAETNQINMPKYKFQIFILVLVIGIVFISFNEKPKQVTDESVPYPEGYRGWTHVKTYIVGPKSLAFKFIGGFDHVYALLLTFGVAILMEGGFRLKFGVSGQPYPNPLTGGLDIGVTFLPMYVQVVLERSSVTAGLTLTMVMLGWPIGATLTSRTFHRIGLWRMVVTGAALIPVGASTFVLLGSGSSPVLPAIGSFIIGAVAMIFSSGSI